jgi:multiple sugar transport system permease protein
MKINRKNNFWIHTVLIGAVLLTVIPYVWMFLTSVKTQGESIMVPPKMFPEVWRWDNYKILFQTLPFDKFFINTFVSTVVITVFQVFFCAMAAYSFARLKFPGKKVIFIIILSIMMVPWQIYLIPQYMIIQKLGLLNTISALILPSLFSAYGTFLLINFFESIPMSLEEAAIIDGCSYPQIFFKIMLPLVVPGLIALAILVSLWSWNSLMWPLIVNSSTDKMTLSAGLANLSGRAGTKYPLLMAGSVLASVPMILFFFLLQKKFIAGISASGTKG